MAITATAANEPKVKILGVEWMGEKVVGKHVIEPSDVDLAAPFHAELNLECVEPIQGISVQVVYSSSGAPADDQVLDEYYFGPLLQGINKAQLKSIAGPNLALIKPDDRIGMSILLMRFSVDTCDAKSDEERKFQLCDTFAQVGWFISQQEAAPASTGLTRSFIGSPSICKYDFNWSIIGNSDTVSGRPLKDVFGGSFAPMQTDD
jgi:hypothetical protein